jgi:hypothetical protein
MATETQSRNGQGSRHVDFTPIDCDVNTIEPEAAEGVYTGVIDDVRVSATSKDKFPMLVVDWKLDATETDTPEAEKSVGATVSDFFAFFPDGDRRGNFPKRRFRQLRELLDIGDDLLPTRLESKDDFNDIIAELKGKETTIYLSLREDKETKELRPSISYTAPRGGMSAMPSDDEDEKPRGGSGRSAPARKPSRPAARGRR